MTKEEILQCYEEELERISKQNEEALRAAKEWCRKKLKEAREVK